MPDLITTSNRERGTADRLYDLLDTLIAARATFELADDGSEGAAALGRKARGGAKHARRSDLTTKRTIGGIKRPPE